MIKNVEPITSREFNKGLVTRADFLKGDINSSPNTMDIQWGYDAALRKRLGASSTNTAVLGTTVSAGWILDTNGSLSTSIKAYYKLEEASGQRIDQIGTNNLTEYAQAISSIVGIRGQAVSFVIANSQVLTIGSAPDLAVIANSNWTISAWFYMTSTGASANRIIASKSNAAYIETDVQSPNNFVQLTVANSSGAFTSVSATSFGGLSINTWYNVVAWHSNNSHIGISVNLSATTAAYTAGVATNNNSMFSLAAWAQTDGSLVAPARSFDGRIDEVGVWNKVLSAQERLDLYANGSGNTYSGSANSSFAWACFDFGASSIRWLTVAAGTGLYASSNRGTTFVVIGTTRTQSYQYLDRSKNVLIATSDQYDVPLFWAGSAGTFAQALAVNSAPSTRFSINYSGFLILLNSSARKRGFWYADENLQLTDPWTNSFDIPSSLDDEITAVFVLNKFLYVSTRYRIFRVALVGGFISGSQDWSVIEIKRWGFVPRTVRVLTLRGQENFYTGGQVAIGLDWDRRLRMFDGYSDHFISDSIENDNKLCDFAMNKISYAGSGLQIVHAELDPIQQEYRLNVAIGALSTQTTHAIILNLRSLAFYPYSNQPWQTMCVAESNNQRALMAVDRSGFVFILNSGNLDAYAASISEVYDSPPLFSKTPEIVSKGRQLNLFFGVSSSGTLYYQDQVDLSSVWSSQIPLSDNKGNTSFLGTESSIKLVRTINTPSIYNTYRFRLTSSSGTTNAANPWEWDRMDYLQQGFGVGKGN